MNRSVEGCLKGGSSLQFAVCSFQGTAPPDPPLQVGSADPVPLEVRRWRVEQAGSRRKRDLAAVAADDARRRREAMAQVVVTPEAEQAWAAVQAAVISSVPDSTANLWLRPLQLVGAAGETLHLSAPDGIRSWVERRYAGLLREALEAVGGQWRQVSFAPVEVASCP